MMSDSDAPNHRLHQPSLANTATATALHSSASIVPASASQAMSEPHGISSDMEKMRISKLEAEQAAAAAAAVAAASSAGRKKDGSGVRYAAERVIGNGSFGVVYQATIAETGETVAIKKVLQDPKFKNRELQILSMLDHPNSIRLRHCFYSRGESADEIYLNLVMDFIPETIHKCLRTYAKASKLLPLLMTKSYMYQIARSLNYIHQLGIAHRDIKPQNLLLNSKTHHVLLCDCGSAKQLVKGEPNVAYICSRYYRAPELVFEATQYTTAIDLWSCGCVLGEMLHGSPLFPGESAVDQLIEIIKVLGTPTKDEIYAMNPHHTTFKFPSIKAHPWAKVFKGRAPPAAIDLITRWLCYEPEKRLHPLDALGHEFFDELREEACQMPGGVQCEHLFDFTAKELQQMEDRKVGHKIVPRHLWSKFGIKAAEH